MSERDSKKGTEEQFEELHGLVTLTYIEQIESLRREKKEVPISLLEKAAKWLKDNGVDSPARTGNAVDRLKGQLPQLDDEGNVLPFARSSSGLKL